MSLLLSPPRNSGLGQSLQTFSEYRAAERLQQHNLTGTSSSGELLEYETLALRLAPPAIEICNESCPSRTLITIASANRSGTLVEVVQGLTELGLEVHTARISSDGGWFVDVFEITEGDGRKVEDKQKLQYLFRMLDVHSEQDTCRLKTDTCCSAHATSETTVFELAGEDKAGLLADVTDLLTANSCHVCSVAVWTYAGRVAFVLSATENGKPVSDQNFNAFKDKLLALMNHQGNGIVQSSRAHGEIHHERRLHQVMLMESSRAWNSKLATPNSIPMQDFSDRRYSNDRCDERRYSTESYAKASSSPTDSVSSLHDDLHHDFRSPKFSTPSVKITKCSDRKYWLVNIECKDRNKLLFDTVCTLADMNYDVYHASIDSIKGRAVQEYYIRSRHGCSEWNEAKANMLRAMLEASIQRRFPKGLKVHVRSLQDGKCLTDLAQCLRSAKLSITRAKVKPHSKMSGQTLYLMGVDGNPPDPYIVEEACRNLGGILVERGVNGSVMTRDIGNHKFSFSFLERQWGTNWGTGGSVASSPASVLSN